MSKETKAPTGEEKDDWRTRAPRSADELVAKSKRLGREAVKRHEETASPKSVKELLAKSKALLTPKKQKGD